jgi:hypothetical protein
MWKPKQWLKPDVVETLLQAGIDRDLVEFLGWMTGRANAVNKSKNPVKAARTILATEKSLEWLKKFFERKKQSIQPDPETVADISAAEALVRDFEGWQVRNVPIVSVDDHDEDDKDESNAEDNVIDEEVSRGFRPQE